MLEAELPNKKYFKIGETSALLGIKPHVLRYWESEFPQIRPFKSKTGQRLYRHCDLESLVKIQKLLYKERFTIAGARQALKMPEPNEVQENLLSVKRKLETILQLLK
ncbi:MAG: MerR family transcriptional regulator [Myxococcaceae bacterium]